MSKDIDAAHTYARHALNSDLPVPDLLVLPANTDKPWPTIDAIARLCEFAESALQSNYSGDHWEELREAYIVVREVLKAEGWTKPE